MQRGEEGVVQLAREMIVAHHLGQRRQRAPPFGNLCAAFHALFTFYPIKLRVLDQCKQHSCPRGTQRVEETGELLSL